MAFPVEIRGFSYFSQTQFARPATTPTYDAGDVVGNAAGAVLTLRGIGHPDYDLNVEILSSLLRIDVTSVPTGMTSFRLHFYNASPASALADAATWDLPSGDRSAYLGYVDLGTPVDVGSTLVVQTTQQQTPIRVPAGGTLYGYLVTNGGFTAASGAVYTISLYSVII